VTAHSAAREPSSHRLGQVAVLRVLGERAGEDGPVAADAAGDVECRLPGFAMPTMVPADDPPPAVGIGVEPRHREVGTLVRRLGASSGLMPASRARPRHWSIHPDDRDLSVGARYGILQFLASSGS
jgi:hypothetical protein